MIGKIPEQFNFNSTPFARAGFSQERIMKHQLEKWVNIRSGHPLRSRIEPHQDLKLSSLVAEKPASNTERGFPLLLVQMKDLKNGEEIKWEEVLKTRIKAKKNPNWLKKDQILFQPKGNKFGAFLLKEVPYWTVAAPHLYIIEINQPKLLLPEFLVWQINQVGVREYLERVSGGTIQISISRKDLCSLDIIVPDLAWQEKLVKLSNFIQQEEKLYSELINNRKRTMSLLANQLSQH